MNEERIVQYVELVVQHAQSVSLEKPKRINYWFFAVYLLLHLHSTHLRHLVALALPAEPLVVVRISMCAYIDGLPVHIVPCAFAYVEHTQLVCLVGRHPFLGLGHPVATGAHSLMEGYGLAGAQKLLQLRLIVGHG